jgi:hypothetical protein
MWWRGSSWIIETCAIGFGEEDHPKPLHLESILLNFSLLLSPKFRFSFFRLWPLDYNASKMLHAMSFWTRNPHETDAKIAESLSHSPSGGRLKMWLLGVALAMLPIYYGIRCLQSGHATFFGSRGSNLELTGTSAVAMAIAYIAVGVFIHAHWFWGLHPKLLALSPILKVLAVLTFLGGFGYAAYKIIQL